MNGVLVVDKPAGPTSHDVVDRVRAILRQRRIGHTGTLDPFATGVLPLCLGKATRLVPFLVAGNKRYLARVRFGWATETDDLTGAPLGPPQPIRLEADALADACRRLSGPQLQVPPAYSAKHVAGQRAHELARRGEAFERTAVPVVVDSIEVRAIAEHEAEIEVSCSTGTYIRALARDLGAALGVGAHLAALRRLASGGFSIDQALEWTRLADEAAQRVIPMAGLLPDWPAVQLAPSALTALSVGRDLTRSMVLAGFPAGSGGRFRVLDPQGDLVAIASPRGFLETDATPAVEPVLHPDIVFLES